MEAYCKTSGITYKKTVPDLPPQNRVAECVNHTICSMAHVMLIDTDLCDYFWPFAILTAAHTKQRTPNASLPPNTMPFQLWFHYWADISHLQLFRSCCIAQVISNNLSKFDTCSESGRFLRYAKGVKGYLIWVPNQNNNGGTVKVRWDIIFHDIPPITTSLPIPKLYMPLWDAIDFLDHITISNNINVYMHAWPTTLSMPLI